MRLQEFLDSIPLLIYLVLIILMLIGLIETGFRGGRYNRVKPDKSQMAQVRAIMGASLGLLAFMLAFSFSVAQKHYELRTDAFLLEITAIDAAYRGASLLEEEQGVEARKLLRQFVQLRRDTSDASDRDELEEVIQLIRDAERIHDQLWEVADRSMSNPGDSVDDGIFTNAILEMIKANDERLQATMFNRISPIIWLTLMLMSCLSMIVMGYQAGLTGKRSWLATGTLAVTFAIVMALVTDLDRPRMTLFRMDQSLMIELQNRINQDASSAATVAPSPSAADIAWVAEGEFCEPETVLLLPDDTLLVSNVCDFRQTGNGFLTLLSAQGQTLDWRIVDGLDAPLGMAMLGERLYLVDNNRLKIFDWPGYELLDTVDLETSVANDVAVSLDGVVYVTDSAKHQVIRLLPDGKQSVLIGEARFKGANGIEIYDGHLYVGGERLWKVDLENESVETIGPDWLTVIDGIEFEPDGTMQITPVAGPLVRYRGENDVEILGGPGISSANHGYAASLQLALIPTGFDNTVIAIRISAP